MGARVHKYKKYGRTNNTLPFPLKGIRIHEEVVHSCFKTRNVQDGLEPLFVPQKKYAQKLVWPVKVTYKTTRENCQLPKLRRFKHQNK